MKTENAIIHILKEKETPVVSAYELGQIIYDLYSTREYQGKELNIKKEQPEKNDYTRYVSSLVRQGILSEFSGLRKKYYKVLGYKTGMVKEVVCLMDPFCYVSHLSAMEYHGLTDRIPVKHYLTSLVSSGWKSDAELIMRKDLPEGNLLDYRKIGLPLLIKPIFTKLENVEFHWHNSSHKGGYIKSGDTVRTASIGRTFLDLLQGPDLCGGMRHVVEVYKEHGETYLPLIADELDRHGKPIDKVRAGYLLEELCGIKSERIENWVGCAQRGGSRKLDAGAEYHNVWSEKWKLSLNLF